MNRYLSILIVLLLWSCQARKGGSGDTDGEKHVIAVVNYPLYFFTKSIGGDLVQVYLPALDGDPAYWKPDARMVNNYQKADLIIANGAGYAKWMEKVSLPSSRIVNTSLSFKDQWIETDEGVTHSHGPEGEHVHKGTAFTTWLDMQLALKQAETIHASLLRLLPEKEEELKSNFEKLENTLKELDAKLKNLAAKIGQQPIIVSHPVYQYLAAGYGLNLISLHWEPDEMPAEDEWAHLKELMHSKGARIMLWEEAPIQEIKIRLNDAGIIYTVFDPCSNKPETLNFLEVMEQNTVELENILPQIYPG